MNAPTRLAAFTAALVLVGGAAAAVGNAAGPIGYAAEGSAHGSGHNGTAAPAGEEQAHGADHGGEAAAVDLPGGLALSEHGYTLDLVQDALPVGRPAALALTIQGPDGRPVTDYTATHDKELHLIVVRRDLTGFQHVHPERNAAGTWTVRVTLPQAGEYRVFADFAPGDSTTAMTLGADLSVGGAYDPQPLRTPQRTAVVDGYTVALDGNLVPGRESKLTLTISKDGQPVTDLQPYLAAYGHLVALRDGDLAYLHVHPDGEPGDGRTQPGPGITFYATAPTVGDYGLFLDFKHQDTVRTAAFTARAIAGTAAGFEVGGAGGDSKTGAAPGGPAGPSQAPAAGHSSDGHAH